MMARELIRKIIQTLFDLHTQDTEVKIYDDGCLRDIIDVGVENEDKGVVITL